MGEFIIPIRIQEENDLYSEFDPSGMSFSSDLVAYLSDYIEDRRLGEKVRNCPELIYTSCWSFSPIPHSRIRLHSKL